MDAMVKGNLATSGRQEYKILPPESKPKESKKKKKKNQIMVVFNDVDN